MKNKQHKYILKALICSHFPRMLYEYEYLSDMMLAFEEIDFQSQDLLKGKKIHRPANGYITKEMKDIISEHINNPKIDKEMRNEMMVFYRLMILAVGVLELYKEP